MSDLLRLLNLGLVLGAWVFAAQNAVAQDAPESPYEQVWNQVSALLEVREYSSAEEVIKEAQGEAGLSRFKDQLQTDLRDVTELKRLAKLVQDQAKKLKTGDTVKIGSTEHKLVKFVSDAQGDRLVLESTSGSSKTEKTLGKLDAKSWLALAQPVLTNSAEDRYVGVMYHASVHHGDGKVGQEALNLAASDKISVTHWTARIEAEAKELEEEKSAKKAALDDPLLGSWRMVIGEGKKERRINITFLPKGKTDNSTSTWRKVDLDSYALSAPNGGTAKFSLVQNGEVFKGRMANGARVYGTRQSKAKRGQPNSAKRN